MENVPGFTTVEQRGTCPVLIVDEDALMREMLTIALQSEGFGFVSSAGTVQEALQAIQHLLPCLLIIDYELSNTTGLQFYDQIHRSGVFPPLPGILLSAPLRSEEVAPRPLWIIQEPFGLDTFFASVTQAMLASSRQRVKGLLPLPKGV